MKLRRILLDMDEVLVDFVGGACHVHGVDRDDLAKAWPIGSYDITEAMGLTPVQFWGPILDAGEQFWEGLRETPWVDAIVDLVRSMVCDRWYVVTCPAPIPMALLTPYCDNAATASYSGKIRWLKGYFGFEFDRFVITPYKGIFASEGVLLIDDNEENVNSFVEAGGDALLFPARHNKLHHFASDPVGHITNVLSNTVVRS